MRESDMGQRKLRVTPEFLIDLSKTRSRFRPPGVTCDGLPEDVQFVSARIVEIGNGWQNIELTVSSDEWDDSAEFVTPVFSAITEDFTGGAG